MLPIQKHLSPFQTGTPLPVPPKKEKERFAQKVVDSTLGSPENPIVNWNPARNVTPGELCGYKTPGKLEIFNFATEGSLELFSADKKSHGLISLKDQVVAASVTTAIKSQTQRKSESKGTYIQYDKTRVKQKGKDFKINPTNYRGWVNYQGGHLIDHKFSAKNSHYVEKNYIPIHYFYNAPLKEYLIKDCHAYVEMPIYTPNPPIIGVKGQKDHFHPIPIGILLVLIKDKKIQDAYYFPNNSFDYNGLKKKLGLTKDLAATITPYFKLHASLHALLRPAMLVDLNIQKEGQSKQARREDKFFDLLQDVCRGMSLAECSEEEETITAFSQQVLHTNRLDPSVCLTCDEDAFVDIQGRALSIAFKPFGDFLVRYGIKNALKSEALSIKTRLIFLNVINDFIEHHHEVNEEAFDFIDSLAEEFKSTLQEFERIKNTMNLEELLYFAETYQRIASPFNHDLATEGYDIYDFGDMEDYFKRLIHLLVIIKSKYPAEKLKGPRASHLMNLLSEADTIFEYITDTYSLDEWKEEGRILKSMRTYALELLEKHDTESGSLNVLFQTSIDRETQVRTSVGYLQHTMENLGISDDEESSSSSDNDN